MSQIVGRPRDGQAGGVHPVDPASLLDPRVLLVTGKGGVGKSSVAAALAVAGLRTGRRTCLVEVEGRQTMAQLFGTQPWDFTEREIRPGLFGLSVDPEASLAEYLEMFYGGKRLSKIVVGSTAVEFATTAAPGIKDVLLVGKVKEMERRRRPDGHFHYDLIVVDAPPTGRIVNFLRAPDATIELVNVGPIRQQAQSVVDMLLDEQRTRVELVTLLEEMPVAETVDSVHTLAELGVAVGPLIVNRVLAERFDDEDRKLLADLEPARLRKLLAQTGTDIDEPAAVALRDAGRAHLERLALQERMRETLDERLSLPRIELPFLYAAEFAAEEVGQLAGLLETAVGR